jgi:hypothetical protein
LKQPNLLKKIFFPILAGSVLLACNLAAAINSSGTAPFSENGEQIQLPSVPVNNPAADAPTTPPPAIGETVVTFGPLTLIVPPELASGASGTEILRNDGEEAAFWQKSPGHWEISLGNYYTLQGKFHQPKIYVYPAQAYAEMVPPAFESIHCLNNILYSPAAPIQIDQLPTVPFFNAQQVFAAHIQPISFQNGSGVRFVTEYSQYLAPVNNHELFYQFQGVTRDGAYYIIAIFPIIAPELAETSDPAAVLPTNGIASPDVNDPNADWEGYYRAITELLNATPADSFSPQLGQMDALIQSMVIAP